MTTPLEPVQSPGKGTAAAALTPPARGVHRRVLQAFAATGLPPEPAELRRIAREQGAQPDGVLAELAACDVVAFDDAGRIRAAYPFSPVPTAIRMRWPGGPEAYAMCAIDALGTSAMLGRPIVITAQEPDTGRAVTVEVDGDHAVWRPDTVVVFAGALGEACCGLSVDRSCGTINFFATACAAEAWAESHPHVTRRVLDQAETLASAIAQFGTLLREP